MFFIPGRRLKGSLPAPSQVEKEIAANLSKHVWTLAGTIGPRSLTSAPDNLEKAATYIEEVFGKFSYALKTQEYTAETQSMSGRKVSEHAITFPTIEHQTRNIIAERTGKRASNEILIVGAHYDFVYDCPAANDNGSGVAVLLELARLLETESFGKTVRLAAFTNEEPPFFMTEQMGSRQYSRLCFERGDKVVGMISLETMGYFSEEPGSQTFPHSVFGKLYPTTGNFIAFISNIKSRNFLCSVARAFGSAVNFPFEAIALPEIIRGVSFSDHASQNDAQYHDEQDTPDKVDYDRLSRITSGLRQVICDLAK